MEALIPVPADCEVRSVIKFLNAQSIAHSLSKFNLPLIGSFYVTHAARALQSHDLSGEGMKLWITDILF